MIEVTFSYNEEDALAIAAENPSPAVNLSLPTFFLVLALSLAPLTVLAFLLDAWWTAAIGWGIVVLGIGGLFLRAWWGMAATANAEPFLSTFRFSQECAEESGKQYVIRLAWQLVREVRATEQHLVLAVDSTEWAAPRRFAAVIPKRAFATPAEADACLEYCRNRIEEERGKPLAPLIPRADLLPGTLPQGWQDSGMELRYRHADTDARRFDTDGQSPSRSVSAVVESLPFLLVVAVGALWFGYARWQGWVLEASLCLLVGFVIVPWMMVAFVMGVVRSMLPEQPAAILNPVVTLITHPQGMYFRTDLSEGFLPSAFLPSIEEGEDHLFFRGADNTIGRVVPRTAFRDEDHLRVFLNAFEAARAGVVMAEGVNRVPPSNNPYRSPEAET